MKTMTVSENRVSKDYILKINALTNDKSLIEIDARQAYARGLTTEDLLRRKDCDRVLNAMRFYDICAFEDAGILIQTGEKTALISKDVIIQIKNSMS